MADLPKKPARLSTAQKPVMRSHGFLSHGGANASGDGENRPKRSRGMLSHQRVNENTPQELDPKKPSKPYSLESK
jgi:hypothetical protein